MSYTSVLRMLPVVLLPFTAFSLPAAAEAASPPNMPLPSCVEVEGQQQGACPATSPDVTGEASGQFTTGGTVTITTIPTDGICVQHTGGVDNFWTPSPCFSAVRAPTIATCAVIDLSNDGVFRELPCGEALYMNPQNLPTPLFSMHRTDGSAVCGGAGDFQTYLFGGPANVSGARWSEFGPDRLDCEVTFNGPRPDGLYGPTWVKVNVGIDQAQNDGTHRRSGDPRNAQIYVPIDGDMREYVDVSVLATTTIEDNGDHLTATYTAMLTNLGNLPAEDVEVMFTLPKQVHFIKSASDGRCGQPAPFVGGNVVCRNLNLAGTGSGTGSDTEFVDVVVRIINSSDLEPEAIIEATVADDTDLSNNTNSTLVRPTLRPGTILDTRQAMEALAPWFDYKTAPELLDQQCNVYMDDVFERLRAIHAQAPEVFENLSYGKITSGDYYWAPVENKLTRAGHVGVVVYLKGTDYHQTGIVIHGTPTWSPTDLDLDSQLGTMAAGDHVNPLPFAASALQQGTQGHGWYYRTPITNFPGSPIEEGTPGCGFEGMYPDNADEFEHPQRPSCGRDLQPQTCPAFPDAVIVRTESPVEIIATNSRGQRVETLAGGILTQTLDSGIHSFASPHEDGTFGWTLVLPKDNYDIELLGTDEGPYKLMLTIFDENDEPPVKTVVEEGTTRPDQINGYSLVGASTQDSSGGGGGSLGFFTLLALLPWVRWRMYGVAR